MIRKIKNLSVNKGVKRLRNSLVQFSFDDDDRKKIKESWQNLEPQKIQEPCPAIIEHYAINRWFIDYDSLSVEKE